MKTLLPVLFKICEMSKDENIAMLACLFTCFYMYQESDGLVICFDLKILLK